MSDETNGDLTAEGSATLHSIAELRAHIEQTYATKAEMEQRLDRVTMDVVREVTRTVSAMVKDGLTDIKLTLEEDRQDANNRFQTGFEAAYQAQRQLERQERREDIVAVFGRAKYVVLYVTPFLLFVIALMQVIRFLP